MNTKPKGNDPKKERQNMRTENPDELLTLAELAQRLKLHPDTARGLYRRGVIPGIKLGHRTLRFDYGQVLLALRLGGDATATHHAHN